MKVRKVSISLKMAVIVALLLIVTDCILGFIVYRDQSNSMIEQIKANAIATADCISGTLEENKMADLFDSLKPGDEGTKVDGIATVASKNTSESENMLEYMTNSTEESYNSLIETSGNYKRDIRNLIDMMISFCKSSEDIYSEVENINSSIKNIGTAVNESVQGITLGAESIDNIATNMSSLNNEASDNLKLSESINENMNKFVV